MPIRDKSTNPLCLISFANTTLVDVTIENLLESENINQIVVSTPNERISSYIKSKYNDEIIVDLRPNKLARINTHIEDTVKYIIQTYKIEADTISVVNYEYPLRKSFYVDKAINTMYLFDAENVISVIQENSNFYLHKGDGLKSFTTNSELRLERDFIYRETGGIHTVKANYFKQYGKILSDKSTHIVIDEKAAKQMKSEEDFEYFEYLYKKENSESFSK